MTLNFLFSFARMARSRPAQRATTVFLVVDQLEDAFVPARGQHARGRAEGEPAFRVQLAEEQPVVHHQRTLEPQHLLSRAYLPRVRQSQVQAGTLLALHAVERIAD